MWKCIKKKTKGELSKEFLKKTGQAVLQRLKLKGIYELAEKNGSSCVWFPRFFFVISLRCGTRLLPPSPFHLSFLICHLSIKFPLFFFSVHYIWQVRIMIYGSQVRCNDDRKQLAGCVRVFFAHGMKSDRSSKPKSMKAKEIMRWKVFLLSQQEH